MATFQQTILILCAYVLSLFILVWGKPMAPQTRDYQLQNITFIVFMYQLTLKQKLTNFGLNQFAVKTYENIALQLVYFMMFYIDPLINQDTYIKRYREI